MPPLAVADNVTALLIAESDRRLSAELFASVFDNAPIGQALLAPNGRRLRVNRALCAIGGYSEAELLAGRFEEITHPEDVDRDRDLARRALAGELDSYQVEKRYRHRDGHEVWTKLSMSLVRDELSAPRYFIAQVEDISERKRIEAALRERDRELSEAHRLARLGTWEWDLSEAHARWSEETCRIFGRPPGFRPSYEEFIGAIHPDDRAALDARVGGVAPEAESDSECRILRPDGELRHVHIRRFGRVAAGGAVEVLFGTVQDVTDQRLADVAIRQARRHAETIVEAMSEGYALTVDGTITTVNEAMCELTGFARDELVGAGTPFPFWPTDELEASMAIRDRIVEQGGGTFDIELMRADGCRFDAEITCRPALNPDGSLLGFVNTIRDVSERRRHEAELERLASRDALTGLANHRIFHERLRTELALARRGARPLAVVLLDLDHFKRINDTHGHLAGDDALRTVAGRLAGMVREGELLARVGGEEFAWLLPGASGHGALAAAERARRAIAETECPGVGRVTVSAGVAAVDGSGDGDGLYARADAALYRAKAEGRNRTVVSP